MDELYRKFTRSQKEANNKEWYKKVIDTIVGYHSNRGNIYNSDTKSSKRREMKINYDLFNNIIHLSDFEKVCSPFGDEIGQMPNDFTNKDIISGKIKALLGMEMKRPFSYRTIATNEEATTRKEQFEFNKLREFVVNSIIEPIKVNIEKQNQQQKGQELTPEQQQEIQQKVSEELKAQTPDEVKLYMEREHQDPAEVLSRQILDYLTQEQDLKNKFNAVWKHASISGAEITWVGTEKNRPTVKVINPLYFSCDDLNGSQYVQDSEWACYEMKMTFTQFVNFFQDEFSDKELKTIFAGGHSSSAMEFGNSDMNNTFGNNGYQFKITVYHTEWKALNPIKFLKTLNAETGEEQEDIVDELYKLNKEAGDIEIYTEWIPSKYEGYKIMCSDNEYAFTREVPCQTRDLDNLYKCKLSYIGAFIDNLNSEFTSFVTRMKQYQYMYNIIWYRLENAIASDYGKGLLLNAGIVPKTSGLTIEKWLHYFRTAKIGFMDLTQEGNKGALDLTLAAKEVNMSNAAEIRQNVELLDYIERRCGDSVGITKQVEGQIGVNEGVGNTNNAIAQSANILEPYFEVHNIVKRDVLQTLLEVAKIAYTLYPPKCLSYVLDDMSIKMLTVDYELLENSTYGLFLSNSMKTNEIIESLKQISHAAMQNQRIEMSDFMNVLKSNSIQEIEEILKKSEKERKEQEAQQQQQQMKSQEEMQKKQIELEEKKMKHEMDMMITQENMKTERELQKQTILSLGFNVDKDMDKDGTPDIMEIYKEGKNAELRQSELQLKRDKLEQDKIEHQEKMALEDKKLKEQILKNKISNK